MDVWDLVILACASGFAVAALVRMMAERHKELIRKRASEIDPIVDEIGSNSFDEKHAA